MRPQKIDDTELMEKVSVLFRTKGFAGTSLSDIAEITGLKKASLYHRFPGGKEELGRSVLDYASNNLSINVIEVLKDESEDAEKRLEIALKNISEFYQGGESQCLLRSLSMEIGSNLFEQELYVASLRWLSGFTKIGTDFGFTYQHAEEIALKALMTLQGSLIISKTLKTTKPFESAISDIRTLYIDK